VNRSIGVRLGLIIVTVVVLQVGAVSHLRVAGVHPEVVWLLPIAAGLIAGTDLGIISGFSAGLLLDCLMPTPFGLGALIGVILGLGAGLLSERGVLTGIGDIWWLTPLLGAGGCAMGTAMFGVLGIVFGQEDFAQVDYLIAIPVVALFGALVAVPITLGVAWALGESGAGRRRSRSRRGAW